MIISHCTDIHLDSAQFPDQFITKVLEQEPDYILIGGDISNGVNLTDHLEFLSKEFKDIDVAFVLGNHDYYHASISEIKHKVSEIVKESHNLHWLPETGPIRLQENIYLVGNGLWCDWRAGNIHKTNIWLNDYQLIDELWRAQANVYYKGLAASKSILKPVMEKLADQSAEMLEKDIKKAIELGAKEVIVLTHVPTFWDVSVYNGKRSNDEWAPFFVCQVAGEKILDIAAENEHDVNITVFSGHSHGSAEKYILPNLRAINTGAQYGWPEPSEPYIFGD